RGAPRPGCRCQPADRRPQRPRPGRPDARPAERRNRTRASNRLLQGADRRACRGRGRRGRGRRRPDDRRADVDERRGCAAPARRGRARRPGMRVAIVGGTGPFGRGLAARLHAAGDAVTIGSRDAARAKALAGELGVEGEANADAVANAELAVLAVNAEAAVETARSLAGALGSTPLLSVASELGFDEDGARPGAEGSSLAERVAAVVD